MDFMADQLVDGRRIRLLTFVDVCTRECLAIDAGRALRSEDVVRMLTGIAARRGAPRRVYCDNGSEFQSGLVDLCVYTQQGAVGVLAAGQTDGQCAHRIIQC